LNFKIFNFINLFKIQKYYPKFLKNTILTNLVLYGMVMIVLTFPESFKPYSESSLTLKLYELVIVLMLTPFDVTSSATPRGMKTIPIAMNAGRTVPAVIIGCQAGNFCCLNFVSI